MSPWNRGSTYPYPSEIRLTALRQNPTARSWSAPNPKLPYQLSMLRCLVSMPTYSTTAGVVFQTSSNCRATAPGAEAKNSSSSRFRVTSCVSIAFRRNGATKTVVAKMLQIWRCPEIGVLLNHPFWIILIGFSLNHPFVGPIFRAGNPQ